MSLFILASGDFQRSLKDQLRRQHFSGNTAIDVNTDLYLVMHNGIVTTLDGESTFKLENFQQSVNRRFSEFSLF